MGKPDTPATPDYVGAAKETASTQRVNYQTPWGTVNWSPNVSGNDTDPWTQTVSLSPLQQKLLDYNNSTQLGLAQLQGKGLASVSDLFSNLPKQSDLPAQAINPGQTAQDAILARELPILNQQQDRLTNQLANQGIQMGSEAYKTAQDQMGRQYNDLYSQAALQGINVGQQARNQAMQEQGFYSQMPINLLNALRSGSQVQAPQSQGYAPGTNYLGAAQAQGQFDMNNYANQVGAYNSGLGGLASLGGLGLLGWKAGLFSDRRLKSNVVAIGTHPIGVTRYEYDIFDRREIGVMADELERVMPEAVTTTIGGLKMVNYDMIGGR